MATKTKEFDGTLPREMMQHTYPILFEVEESHWWYVGRRRIIEAFVQDICAGLKPGRPRILDVGCGTGANLKMLGAHGEVAGVDISQQALELCRQRGVETVRIC